MVALGKKNRSHKALLPLQSRGFGFVHMDNAESASNAASGMSGKMMDGRALVVRLRSEGPGQKPDRPRGFGPSENDESKVIPQADSASTKAICSLLDSGGVDSGGMPLWLPV